MARLMSETFGTRHHEYEIDGTETSALPDIVRFLGEPFMEGGLMVNYCAMRMIGDDKPDVILEVTAVTSISVLPVAKWRCIIYPPA